MIRKCPELEKDVHGNFCENEKCAVKKEFVALPEVVQTEKKADRQEKQDGNVEILVQPYFPDIFQNSFYRLFIQVPDWKQGGGKIGAVVFLVVFVCVNKPEPDDKECRNEGNQVTERFPEQFPVFIKPGKSGKLCKINTSYCEKAEEGGNLKSRSQEENRHGNIKQLRLVFKKETDEKVPANHRKSKCRGVRKEIIPIVNQNRGSEEQEGQGNGPENIFQQVKQEFE
jgi:hypothetical protein